MAFFDYCPDIIPDLARIVFEYSTHTDRKRWNFQEDTSPYYDQLVISVQNLADIERMTNIIISQVPLPPYIRLPLIRIVEIANRHNKTLSNMINCPNLTHLYVYYTKGTVDLTYNTKLESIEIGPCVSKHIQLPKSSSLKSLILANTGPMDLSDQHKLEKLYLYHDFSQSSNVSLAPLNKPLDLTPCSSLTNISVPAHNKSIFITTSSQPICITHRECAYKICVECSNK